MCPLDLLVGDPWGAESIEQCVVHRHPLTHSFSGYLLSIHDVPGTVLGARDMVPSPVSSSGGKSQQEPRF